MPHNACSGFHVQSHINISFTCKRLSSPGHTSFQHQRHISSMQVGAAQGYVSTHGEGTLAYAAPELLWGERCSEKVDIYSFGVLLWELATAERPMRGQRRDVRCAHSLTDEFSAKTQAHFLQSIMP